MVDVLTEIVIQRPASEVSSFAADPRNATQWYENIKEARILTPTPLAVGTRIAFMAYFLKKRLEYEYEVTEFIPGEKLVMRTAQGPFPMETTYTWTVVNKDTTRMTLRNRGTPKGFSKLFSPFMTKAMRKANTKDLQRIKMILENG